MRLAERWRDARRCIIRQCRMQKGNEARGRGVSSSVSSLYGRLELAGHGGGGGGGVRKWVS